MLRRLRGRLAGLLREGRAAGRPRREALADGTRRRLDGRLQLTYNGWPLYYYANEGPREVRCHNVDHFGGIWRVVRPNGSLVP